MSEEKQPTLGDIFWNTYGSSFNVPWSELTSVHQADIERGVQAVLDNRTPWGDANMTTIEEHRWYAVVRNGGPDADVFKVIGYCGDSGLSYCDSIAEWEAKADL